MTRVHSSSLPGVEVARTAGRRRREAAGATWSWSSSSRPAVRYCWATLAPPATATSLSPAAARACSSADSIPSVTNVNVVPPCMVSGSRAWCVSTNTGWWKGGSSPHQPSAFGSSSHGPAPPLNIRRPITVAPVLRSDLLDDLGVGVRLATGSPVGLAPAGGREGPFVERLAARARAVVERLVRSRDEAVERYRDVEDQLLPSFLLRVGDPGEADLFHRLCELGPPRAPQFVAGVWATTTRRAVPAPVPGRPSRRPAAALRSRRSRRADGSRSRLTRPSRCQTSAGRVVRWTR